MHEIVPDILTWAWFSEPHGYNFNGYLVRHPEGNLCIDPVPPGDADLAEIVRMGVTRILLTNRNHSRAANVIRERTGARTFIPPDDAAHARSQGAEIDGELAVDEPIGPLAIVAVPGKSPGEVAFHWPERGLLIVGDAVIGNPPGRCGLIARKGDGRSGAPQGKRTEAPRPPIQHAALRRRGVDRPRRQSAVAGAGRDLSGRVRRRHRAGGGTRTTNAEDFLLRGRGLQR